MPPVRGASRLALALGPRGLLDFSRMALLSVRRLAREQFRGEGGALLLAGNALHSDVDPDSPPSGFLGWFLTCIGQQHGFPVPEGARGSSPPRSSGAWLLAAARSDVRHRSPEWW